MSRRLPLWSREAAATGKAAESTLKSYGTWVRKLVTFLGHDDAARVTPENVVAFKDARLDEINPRNGKPVKGHYREATKRRSLAQSLQLNRSSAATML